MKLCKNYIVTRIAYDNDLDAWEPELWSAETLAILEDNMVIGSVCNRDYQEEFSSMGRLTHTRRPNTYEAMRKSKNSDITIQESSAEDVPVVLDQHIHVSFDIKDEEETVSIPSLINNYMRPAALAMATKVDRILLNQVHQFYTNRDPGGNNTVGHLGTLSVSNAKRRILEVGQRLDENRCPEGDRWMFVTPSTKTTVLELDIANEADKVGDDGTKLREASIGRFLGFNWVMGQNVPYANAMTTALQADELASDAAAGDTVISVDSGLGFTVGQYITLEGDLMPYRIIEINTNDLTLNRPLRYAVPAATSDINVSALDTVDLTGHSGVTAYPAGYDELIKVDASANFPVRGSLASFNTAATVKTYEYGIVRVLTDVTGTYIELDKPLQEAVLDGDTVGYGHIGSTNFAFHPNAFTMVVRPLVQPRRGAGAISGIADFNNLAMRTTIAWLPLAQKHVVTFDFLFGVSILEKNFGVPFLA